MKDKPKTLRPIHANQGIEAAYRKRLNQLNREMADSVEYWMQAGLNADPPALFALDAVPVSEVLKRLRKIAKQWKKRYAEVAPKIADLYVKGQSVATQTALRNALKQNGFAIQFKMTPAMRDALTASVEENVALIKSIPEEYLFKVQGIVTRGYSRGYDLGTMVKELKKLRPELGDRAVTIARDQSNKINAVTTSTRQLELGIVKARWRHSHGGRVPRASHVKADGKIYEVAKGCLIDSKYIYPGQLINCRCIGQSILPRTLKGVTYVEAI